MPERLQLIDYDDPDLGRVLLVELTLEQNLAVRDAVDAFDHEAAAEVIDVQASDDPDVDPVVAVRAALFMHGLVRAAVVAPAPPTMGDELVERCPPLGLLIEVGSPWTPAAILRIFELVLREP